MSIKGVRTHKVGKCLMILTIIYSIQIPPLNSMLNACHYEGLNIAHSLQMTNQNCFYLPPVSGHLPHYILYDWLLVTF